MCARILTVQCAIIFYLWKCIQHTYRCILLHSSIVYTHFMHSKVLFSVCFQWFKSHQARTPKVCASFFWLAVVHTIYNKKSRECCCHGSHFTHNFYTAFTFFRIVIIIRILFDAYTRMEMGGPTKLMLLTRNNSAFSQKQLNILNEN